MIRTRLTLLLVLLLLVSSFAACGEDTYPASDPDGGVVAREDASAPLPLCEIPSRDLDKWAKLPGLTARIMSVNGGSGTGGNIAVGDTISVTFTAGTGNGDCRLPIDELDGIGLWLSGPTTNYQRVLPRNASDSTNMSEKRAYALYEVLRDQKNLVLNADGTYTYTFPDKIPATYTAPLWDTPKFSDGEQTDKPLIDGTYSIQLRAFRRYVSGKNDEIVDPSNDIKYVLFGAAAVVDRNELVTIANCNVCHTTMQRHSGIIRDTRLCVTCHTSGAEDADSTDTSDPTPVTTEFRVMIHKIHMAKHLPSVVGVATNTDGTGTRNYNATPVRYVVGSSKHDFSTYGLPVAPNYRIPMPRDVGFSTLSPAAKKKEDLIRTGPTLCEKCHGDPDGAGPFPAPANGDRAYTNMSRRACGSCHDDVDWTQPYMANTQTQPPQANDNNCQRCHKDKGDGMAVQDAHLHPIKNPAINPGLVFTIQALGEAGSNDGNGKFDPGEKIAVTFAIKDDSGADVSAKKLTGMSMVVTGPTINRNLLIAVFSFPLAALPDASVLAMNIPEEISLEILARAAPNDGVVESFVTSRTPHWNVTEALTSVSVRAAGYTAGGGNSTLTADARAGQNFVDVASTTGFARNDYIVLDDLVPAAKEIRKVIWVDDTKLGRLWLNAPLRKDHITSATAQEVTLATMAATTFTLNAATGTITEALADSFAAGGDVVVTYTSDFVIPAKYPPALHDSPDLDETWGKWAGKDLVPGTYTFGVWGSRTLKVDPDGKSNPTSTNVDATTYTAAGIAATRDFLVGDANTLVPWSNISSAQNCNTCHQDLMAHSGRRRGLNTCILCHGNAGGEDRQRYESPNAPATTGLTINYRGLIHKAHMGEKLAEAATYQVVEFATGAYPNDFVTKSFEGNLFPTKPGGAKQCAKCHGELNTAWLLPSSRNHPTQQGSPTRTWRASCGSCHDSQAAQAHINQQTYLGQESCAVCHGPNGDFSVAVSHKEW